MRYKIYGIKDNGGWIITKGTPTTNEELKSSAFLRGSNLIQAWAISFAEFLNSPQGNVPEETIPPSENGER